MKTEEEFKKLKESLESEHNREFTEEEVEKALDDLKIYARILLFSALGHPILKTE